MLLLQSWTLLCRLFTIPAVFQPQAELEEAFIYVIRFFYRFFPVEVRLNLRSYCHWLETSKGANRNLVPSPNTKNHLLSLSELADRK